MLMTMYPGSDHTALCLMRCGWSITRNDWSVRISRAVVAAFELGMNLSATCSPPGASHSHTSANPPRPRTRFSRYPGEGSAPTWRFNAPGVLDRIFGKNVNAASPSW
jgi:hypothetical protein